MRDRIHCRACDGTGRAPLDGVLRDTLALVRRFRGRAVSAGDLILLIGGHVQQTAMCNRLTTLARHGFVERVPGRRGREVVYRAKGRG